MYNFASYKLIYVLYKFITKLKNLLTIKMQWIKIINENKWIGGKTYECKGKKRSNPSCINNNNNCPLTFLRQEL